VLSGEEEAVCGFAGVSGDNNVMDGCVIDIGGGSTEIVSFKNKTVEKAASFSIGSLNTYKNFVKNILPAKTELSEIKKEVKRILNENEVDRNISCAYGVGGTIRAVLRLYNEEYKIDDSNRIMESDKIKKLMKLYSEKKNYMTDKIIKIAPERLHTIIPGLTILCTVLKLYNLTTVTVSKYGVREGYLIRYILK
jgi:exopolyphosphatase/guanosine-5'-triphosphate,3'-diphosphate pyrophosphatase